MWRTQLVGCVVINQKRDGSIPGHQSKYEGLDLMTARAQRLSAVWYGFGITAPNPMQLGENE